MQFAGNERNQEIFDNRYLYMRRSGAQHLACCVPSIAMIISIEQKKLESCLLFRLPFRLPLELRQQIYSFLLSKETIPSPFSGVGLQTIECCEPSIFLKSNLRCMHSIILGETMNYFYSITNWRIVCGYSLRDRLVDHQLQRLEVHPILSRISTVNLWFWFNIASTASSSSLSSASTSQCNIKHVRFMPQPQIFLPMPLLGQGAARYCW